MSSIIETSDGALAALGVGHPMSDNIRIETICLIKTEPFLPLPAQTPLPTAIPSPAPTTPATTSQPIPQVVAVTVAVVIVLVVGSSVIWLMYRKHKNNK